MRALQKPIRYIAHHFEERTAAPPVRCRNLDNNNISYVNRSPIRYGFCVGRKVIHTTDINIAHYASLVTLIQPIQKSECDVFWEKRSKNYFCDNGGPKYFQTFFDLNFQNTLCNSSIPGPPLGKLGPLSS